MADSVTAYRVFIASPSGLEAEREVFRKTIHEYNESDAFEAGVIFHPVGWETLPPRLGRPQELINEDLRKCDCFVLFLWDRWGSPPGPGSRYASGTEEEYEVAMSCVAEPVRPMRHVAVFFKGIAPERLRDPGPQLHRVLEFRRELERSSRLLFGTFDESAALKVHLRRLLATWLREHHRGAAAGDAVVPRWDASWPLPTFRPTGSIARGPSAEQIAEAERLADQGRVTDAEALFARAILQTQDLDALNRYGLFLVRLGRLAPAQVIFERILALAQTGEERWQAEAYANLGLIHRTRGDLNTAESCLKHAIAIDDRLGQREVLAIHRGYLGMVFRARGELGRAEEAHQSALALDQEDGRLEGIAVHFGNLGVIHQLQGDLQGAERMQTEALKIEQRLDRAEGIANARGNLGVVALQRGRLEEAERLLKEALAIDGRIGRLEGIANHWGHLGVLYRARGDLDQATRALNRALEINEQLDRPKGIAQNYGDMAVVLFERGELEAAERVLRKALQIDERLGRTADVARSYALLGRIYEARGEAAPARALLARARELSDRSAGAHHERQDDDVAGS